MRIFWLTILGSLAFSPASHTQESAKDAVVAISPALCADMKTRKVLTSSPRVGCDRLKLVKFRYIDFDGKQHDDGRIVVMDAAADHVLAIFIELRQRGFPLTSAKLMNEFDGDDDASMDRNNTSAFNDRAVAGGTAISMHAFGLAIDLNPVQNPYVRGAQVDPKAGAAWLDRKKARPGMAESVVDVFAHHGFVVWGGEWASSRDYQHFQVSRAFAAALTRVSPAQAHALFERHVARYRSCVAGLRESTPAARRACAAKT